MSVNSMKMLSKKDIDATDKFVYSVSNGSILEDTPYKITVSEGFVSISIKTNTSNIDETFAITDSQYSMAVFITIEQPKLIRNIRV